MGKRFSAIRRTAKSKLGCIAFAILLSAIAWNLFSAYQEVPFDENVWSLARQHQDYLACRKMTAAVITHIAKENPPYEQVIQMLGEPDFKIGVRIHYKLGLSLLPPRIGVYTLAIVMEGNRAISASITATGKRTHRSC